MADENTSTERAYGITNIKTHIPIVLDLEECNYDAWRELFLMHSLTFDVLGHVDGTLASTGADDATWHKRDALVKLWLYGTMTKSLFKSTFQKGGTAHDVWTRIENQFRNNKEARVMQLDSDLRNKEIGDLTVHDYCQQLKSDADLLANLEAPVPDKTLVMYMLNGLNEKFDYVLNVIKHQKPFPSFEDAKNMLEMEEARLKKTNKTVAAHKDNASSSTALIATNPPKQSNQTNQQQYNNNRGNSNRGNKRGNRGRGRYNNYNQRPFYNWNTQPPPFWYGAYNSNWNPQQQTQLAPWQQQPQAMYPPRPYAPTLHPQAPTEAHMVNTTLQPPMDYTAAFNTMTLTDPSQNGWFMDTGATAHLASTSGILQSVFNTSTGNTVTVGNGNTIPVLSTGYSSIPTQSRLLHLKNVLVAPNIVKNLVSVRRFTTDNWCSVEFDPFGFSVKDLQSRKIILRSDSQGDLYPVPSTLKNKAMAAVTTESSSTWHRRLIHTNNSTLHSLITSGFISCNKDNMLSCCNACQIGKHTKLPFQSSKSQTTEPFQIVHTDVWTSPVPSISGCKYYVLFLDDYTHYLWVYPLRRKSDVFSKFLHFEAYVDTQFKTKIQSLQCDNGGEYNNSFFHDHFSKKGIIFRFSCPHTSQQNGKSERMIRTLNNAIRTLLFQSHLAPAYWAEALHTAAHVLNILPSASIGNQTPHYLLYKQQPSYSHLRTFGCLCFPNLNFMTTNKLSPRSTPCLFLGYPTNHRGYRCLDLKTNRIIISRHVVFDENTFPKSEKAFQNSRVFDFLETDTPSPVFKHILQGTKPVSSSQPPPAPSTSDLTSHAPPHSLPAPRMTTRSQVGIRKPKKVFSLYTASVSRIPTSPQKALADPNWNSPMTDEYDAQIKNKTWSLVPRPFGANIINSMWLYKEKHDADGNPTRNKARLVANGKSQQAGVDYDETFSPVVKPATIRMVLNLAVSRGWELRQLDVKNAFLHGTISETIYMHQPPGFVDKSKPHHVCKLNKALYGLKQAPRAWNARFASYLTRLGFVTTKSDTSLFVYRKGNEIAYLLLYVDDIVLTGSSKTLVSGIISQLKKEFPITDMGRLNYFLGIKVEYNKSGILLSQKQYATEIIARAGMSDCKPVSTPVDVNSKLAADAGDLISTPTEYRSLAGALQYLTFTRPDIAYAVHQVCLYMHAPRDKHMSALRRIIRYIKGTTASGLQMYKTSTQTLYAYTDADWAGCPDTRRSTSGFAIYLGDNLISWSSKRQQTVSRSSAEAEYKGIANAVAETCFLRNLLLELHCPIRTATIVYCDNVSSVYLSSNPVKHQRTKHVEIDLHFVREKVAIGQVKVIHVPSSLQYADIFTKGLPTTLFNDFRYSLNVRCANNLTEGG